MGGGGATVDYSTNEQNTGVKWIDGKYIYRKVIDMGTLPNNTAKIVNTGITNFGRLIDLTVLTVRMVFNYSYAPDRISGSYALAAWLVDSTGAQVKVESNYDASATDAFIIICYTKSS